MNGTSDTQIVIISKIIILCIHTLSDNIGILPLNILFVTTLTTHL